MLGQQGAGGDRLRERQPQDPDAAVGPRGGSRRDAGVSNGLHAVPGGVVAHAALSNQSERRR